MNNPRAWIFIALAGTLLPTAHALAQTAPDTLDYLLAAPPSQFEYGCFAPCACPIITRAPLTGSFLLRRSRIDPLYTYYDVLDVRWKIPDATHAITITGSGVYRRGGEVAMQEQLTLDLSFDGGPVQHFDSGLKAPGAVFPEIKTSISLHGGVCLDSVLTIDAKPYTGTTGVGGGTSAPSLSTSPNPFGSSTEIAFALPQPGVVSLGVFDLNGRRVRGIVTHQWVAGGPQTRVWDGRLDQGMPAPAGLYFVRLETASRVLTRRITKLQ